MILAALVLLALPATAQYSKRGSQGSNPIQILDNVAANANYQYRIQDTQLNDASAIKGKFGTAYRITNALDDLRSEINPYLQWMIFIGLSAATMLLVYNGFRLVISGMGDAKELGAVTTNVENILKGVFVLTGFYTIVRLISIIINMISNA